MQITTSLCGAILLLALVQGDERQPRSQFQRPTPGNLVRRPQPALIRPQQALRQITAPNRINRRPPAPLPPRAPTIRPIPLPTSRPYDETPQPRPAETYQPQPEAQALFYKAPPPPAESYSPLVENDPPAVTYRPNYRPTPEPIYRSTPSETIFRPSPQSFFRPAEDEPKYIPELRPKPRTVYRGEAQTIQETYEDRPARYEFAWDVKDDESGNLYGHSEQRNGKEASGKYFVLLPDGRIQTVEYTADEYGYHPIVTYSGEARYPEPSERQSQYRPPPAALRRPSPAAPSYAAPQR